MTSTSTGVLTRPRIRNSDRGYGVVTKALHWVTVLALLGQFVVGYAMTRLEPVVPGLRPVHLGLGLGILVLAAVRLGWRVATPLPPWSDRLSAVARKVAATVERVLYALLFLVPLSGLALQLVPGEQAFRFLLGLHVAAHLAFFATLAAHLVLVAKHRLLPRML